MNSSYGGFFSRIDYFQLAPSRAKPLASCTRSCVGPHERYAPCAFAVLLFKGVAFDNIVTHVTQSSAR